MTEDAISEKPKKNPSDKSEDINGVGQASKLPRHRSVLSLTAGLLLMGGCLFLALMSIGMIFSNDLMANPVILLALVAGTVYLAFRQYRLLFCCPLYATRHSFGWLLLLVFVPTYDLLLMPLIGSLYHFSFPLFQTIYQSLTDHRFVTFVLAGAAICGIDVSAFLDMRRRKRIVETTHEGYISYFEEATPLFTEYPKREIFGIVCFTIILLSGTLYFIVNMPPKFGERYTFEQMPRLGQLPEDGFDFNFKYPNRGRFACDFHVTEEGFRKWISTHSRYTDCEEVVDMPLPGHKLLDQSVVINGLLAAPDGKSHNGACFDRKTQRAYYWLWRTPQ